MYTVVIADDEQRICESIKSVIMSAMPELKIVGVFYNGTELHDYLQNNCVDIVLTDIQMPDMSGLDIAKMINNRGHKSYVIIITAHHEFDYAKTAINYRVDAFLTKPFLSQQLVQELKKAIAFFTQKNRTHVENWTVYRSLFQALCINKSTVISSDQIHLCQGSAQLKELKCTELIVQSEYLNLLTCEQEQTMVQELKEFGECDTPRQSAFFIEKHKAVVLFLIFSKDIPPDRETLTQILRIVKHHTGNDAMPSVKSFDSFSSYLTYSRFTNAMELFYEILANSGIGQAESYIEDFLCACTQAHRNDFARFLEDHHHVQPEGAAVEQLLQAIRQIVNQTLGNRSGSNIVDAAKKYVWENYTSPDLSLQSVAEALYVSSGYLSRIFKNKTGQNFSEYLSSIRMEQAQKLLRSTNLSVNEIAFAAGYGSPAYFRASFKARLGMTPRQYQQSFIKEG